MKKTLNWFMDFLMFIVPILELSEFMTFIPAEWLPYYMIATVVARRLLRLLEDNLNANSKVDTE